MPDATPEESYDVIIAGAGPAGLNAALVLGRCRRRVAVFDTGHPRNANSHGVHNFLSRDGIDPHELLRLGREQLAPYSSVTMRQVGVTDARRLDGHFAVTLADGTRLTARKLVLATGVVDDIPDVPGVRELYGRCVHHCPYCDGWEHRDQALAIYGKGHDGAGLALELLCWSHDLVLCTDGDGNLSEKDRERLRIHGIGVREERITCLRGENGNLACIEFEGGETLARDAMFFSTPQSQHSDLPARLGCEFTADGAVRTDSHEATNVPGLYVIGDASRRAQFAIIAAAEGAIAATAINTRLLEEDLAEAERGRRP
jgi:thioredoxin reductase